MTSVLHEMAAAPKTAAKAERLAGVLPPDSKAAKALAQSFWDIVLADNPGAAIAAGSKSKPPTLTDQEILVKQGGKGDDKFPYLVWHAVATFTPMERIHFTMIVTSVDDPGVYRVDFVLLGQKKAFAKKIRDRVSHEVMAMEDKVTMELSPKELQEFERIKISQAKVPHLHKEGLRQDDNLIGRLVMDRIPLGKLPSVAPRVREIVRKIGDIIVDEMTKPVNESVAPWQLTKDEFLGTPRLYDGKINRHEGPKKIFASTLEAPLEPFMDGRYQIRRGVDQYVVYDGDRPIATYTLGDNIGVLPRYRHKGVGSALLAAWKTERNAHPTSTSRSHVVNKMYARLHRDEVARAIRMKEDVPEKVLADYPDLRREGVELEAFIFGALRENFGTYSDDMVVLRTGTVEYVCNDRKRPTYISAFKETGKVGYMSLADHQDRDGKKYLRIRDVSVDKKHRRQGIAVTMYRVAEKMALAAGYAGLISLDEDVASPRAINAIRKRIGMIDPEKSGRFITRPAEIHEANEGDTLTFRDESRGFHHDQYDGTLKVYMGNKEVGHLDYSEFDGRTRIDFIEVLPEYRRQGIGTALFKALKKDHPKVIWSGTTEDGEAFRNVVDPPKPTPVAKPLTHRAFTEADYDAIHEKIRAAKVEGNEPEARRLRKLIDKMATWDRNVEHHAMHMVNGWTPIDGSKVRTPDTRRRPVLENSDGTDDEARHLQRSDRATSMNRQGGKFAKPVNLNAQECPGCHALTLPMTDAEKEELFADPPGSRSVDPKIMRVVRYKCAGCSHEWQGA